MNDFNIGGVCLNSASPVFIIAEAGVNHNGNLEMAKNLVTEAKKAGADCIKFQTFKAERVVSNDAPKANYQNLTTDPKETQLEMLKKCELKYEYHPILKKMCEDLGILFLSTPYNIEDAEFLESINVQAYKLASIHLAEPYFIKKVAMYKKPIILSTGMGSMREIEIAVKTLKNVSNNNFCLLQCTTNYPSIHMDVNLNAMVSIQNKFKSIIGYSDHTTDDISSIVSVGLGAKIIEKHFSLDKTLSGPDHTSSLNPIELHNFVKNIRNAEKVLGSFKKEPCPVELENMKGMRRSIFTKKHIKLGEPINYNSLTFKRPAKGISAGSIDKLIGKKAVKEIKKDTLLEFGMIK